MLVSKQGESKITAICLKDVDVFYQKTLLQHCRKNPNSQKNTDDMTSLSSIGAAALPVSSHISVFTPSLHVHKASALTQQDNGTVCVLISWFLSFQWNNSLDDKALQNHIDMDMYYITDGSHFKLFIFPPVPSCGGAHWLLRDISSLCWITCNACLCTVRDQIEFHFDF